jgi:hypothetical protein
MDIDTDMDTGTDTDIAKDYVQFPCCMSLSVFVSVFTFMFMFVLWTGLNFVMLISKDHFQDIDRNIQYTDTGMD